jgi:ferritin-like protein
MANSVGYHESEENLRDETKDRHRALASMQEELEAVDWYDQRVDAATDDELKEILAHNRDEEIEHFVMVLEWMRRRSPKFSAELRTRLFTEGSITAKEEADKGKAGGSGAGGDSPKGAGAGDGSLGIGSLRGAR